MDKKHPCPDCRCCQWCSDDRCRLCLATEKGCRKKLTMAEQIALYEQINAESRKCEKAGLDAMDPDNPDRAGKE